MKLNVTTVTAAIAECAELIQAMPEGMKFTDADIAGDSTIRQAALDYIHNYNGDFGFVADLAAKAHRGLSTAQLRGGANCLRAEVLRASKPAPAAEAAPAAASPTGFHLLRAKHKYTVVHEDGKHTTFKLAACRWEDKPKGTLVISYLGYGDYNGFGLITPDGKLTIWKGKGATDRIINGVMTLLSDPLAAQEAYAIESGVCARCGRELTNPASLHRGLGPECAKKAGL